MTSADSPARPARRKRWGLRTLGFLTLGLVALFTAMAMGHQTPGTLGCIVIALGGAGYCSIRGVQAMLGNPGRSRT